MLLFKHACDFFVIRPFEELQDSNGSPRREELGRPTLRVSGSVLTAHEETSEEIHGRRSRSNRDRLRARRFFKSGVG